MSMYDDDEGLILGDISTVFRPYSAQPQCDLYEPQEEFVKTAAPSASRNAPPPNPPQPDYSPGDSPALLNKALNCVKLLYLL